MHQCDKLCCAKLPLQTHSCSCTDRVTAGLLAAPWALTPFDPSEAIFFNLGICREQCAKKCRQEHSFDRAAGYVAPCGVASSCFTSQFDDLYGNDNGYEDTIHITRGGAVVEQR